MDHRMDQAVAIAIESYIHAPRVLSVSEVVRQVASVFPDHDTAAIALSGHEIEANRGSCRLALGSAWEASARSLKNRSKHGTGNDLAH